MIHMKFIGKINIYYIVLSLIIYLRQKKKNICKTMVSFFYPKKNILT